MTSVRRATWILAGLMAVSVPAQAGLIVTGDVAVGGSSAGLNLSLGGTENDNIVVFTETAQTLADPLAVNRVGPGFSFSTDVFEIPAGTEVQSYLVHFDPVGTFVPPGSATNPYPNAVGTITFSTRILGIITNFGELVPADGQVGNASAYSNLADRGLEFYGPSPENPAPPADIISVTNGQLTFNMNLSTGAALDDIRIITAVPDGGVTLALLGLAMGCLGLVHRYRSRNEP